MMDAVVGTNIWEHVQIFLSGSTVFIIVAHAVQTFPTPKSDFWQWVLGVIQFAVGQRMRAVNTLQGEGTLTKSVSRETMNPNPKIDNPVLIPKDN